MFNKRTSLNKKKAVDEPKGQCEGSADPSKLPFPDESQSAASTVPKESSDVDSDQPSSFRRGLRDGTITCSVDAAGAGGPNPAKKVPTNLSFTDSLVEDALNNIHLRRPVRSRPSTNKSRGDAALSNGRQEQRSNHKVEDLAGQVDPKPEHKEATENTPEEREAPKGPEPTDYSHYAKLDYESDVDSVELDDPLFLSSDPDDDLEIELELAQVVKGVQDELQMSRDNLKANDRAAKQNSEKLADAELEQMAFDNELEIYFELVETAKALFDLVNAKLPAVKEALAKLRANRTEEHEHLVRMRTWLYCDLLRTAGLALVDYRCGELEDVDEMGRDLSLSIQRGFEQRSEAVEALKGKLFAQSQQDASKLDFVGLESFACEKVVQLFFPANDRDYTLAKLSELYDYRPALEEVPTDFLAEAPARFRSLKSALEVFERFRAKHPEQYASLEVAKNLRVVCEFYASVGLLANHRSSPLGLLDDLAQHLDEPQLLACTVLYPHALDWLAYFDVESRAECSKLAEFLSSVIERLPAESRQANAESLSAALLKALRAKVAQACLKVRAAWPPGAAAFFTDPDVFHMLKFTVVNLALSVNAFHRVLPAEALAELVEELFVKTLLPTLDLDSALDVFAVLAFKLLTGSAEGRVGGACEVSPAVADAYRRCAASRLAPSDSEVFNALRVPLGGPETAALFKQH